MAQSGDFLGFDISNAGRNGQGAQARVELKGLNEVLRMLAMLPVATRRRAGQAMRAEMQVVIDDAKNNYVPIDTGQLKRSGFVKGPRFPTKTTIEVDGGFGPAANPRGSEYAIPVHEIPPPPSQSVGGRSAYHRHGTWKYLQIPWLKHAPSFANNVGMRVLQGLMDDMRGQVIDVEATPL